MKQGIVTGLDLFGQGIIKDEGKCVFVENALTGEKVFYKIVKDNKKYAKAVAVDIAEPVPGRIDPPCPYYGVCGGCCWQHSDYQTEAEAKEGHVLNQLRRIGGLNDEDVFQAMDRDGEIFHYRNKVTWQVSQGRLGFYRKNSRDFLVIEKCLLLEEPLEKASSMLRELDLRNVTSVSLRCNSQGDISCLVQGEVSQGQIEALCQALPGLVTLEANGKIYGNGHLLMSLGEKTYRLAPGSFFQVNTAAAVEMLDYAAQLLVRELGEEKRGTLLDLYCGVGSIGIYLAGLFHRVVGVEAFAAAAADAAYNGEVNGVKGEFLCLKTEEAKDKLIKAGFLADSGAKGEDEPGSKVAAAVGSPRVVVVDPPRSGVTPEAVALIESLAPDYILYISCDPGTLSRDIRRLTSSYTPKSVKPFNLFPRTASVETVTLMLKS